MNDQAIYLSRLSDDQRATKARLESVYGVQTGPASHYLFDLAWDRGHADGDSAIQNAYAEMLPLLYDQEYRFVTH